MSGRVWAQRFSLIPEELLDTVSDRAYRLYGMLNRYANTDGRAFPARKTLADRLGCSLPTLDGAIQELVDTGFVMIVARHRDDGGRTSNDYHLMTSTGTPLESPLGRGTKPALQGLESPLGTIERESEERESDNKDTLSPHGDALCLDGLGDRRAELERERGKGTDYRFEDAWKSYPTRAGRRIGKKQARDQWVKLTYVEKRQAWEAIRIFAGERPELPPDMFRWLRDQKWLDWLEPKTDPAPVLGSSVVNGVEYRTGEQAHWRAQPVGGGRMNPSTGNVEP